MTEEGKLNISKGRKKSYPLDLILSRLENIYKNKFDYTYILEYNGMKRNYMIKCNKCLKKFVQRLDNHLYRKHGCPYCGSK